VNQHSTRRRELGRPCQGGFTIIEFMVAVALLSVLMIGVTSSFTFQQQTYVVVDQVAEAKQNVRVIADLIEREVRNAGYMAPLTATVCGADETNSPDKLYVSDYSQIVAMNALPAELLTQPLGKVVQNPTVAISAGSRTLFVEDLDLDGIGGGPDFSVGAGLILADRNAASTGVACGTITNIGAVAGGNVPITVTLENGTGGLAPGAELVAIPAIVYDVNGNTLRRNQVTLVNQVDDFQVAWFYDLNDDQTVDPGEYKADGQGGADDYEAENLDATLLREVRINVVVRTRDEDPNTSWRRGIGQATENRTAGSVAPVDGARRRTHTSTVRLRNNLS
jgi:prepilin-type N-terminal cleavage/methylation domain-containing protein